MRTSRHPWRPRLFAALAFAAVACLLFLARGALSSDRDAAKASSSVAAAGPAEVETPAEPVAAERRLPESALAEPAAADEARVEEPALPQGRETLVYDLVAVAGDGTGPIADARICAEVWPRFETETASREHATTDRAGTARLELPRGKAFFFAMATRGGRELYGEADADDEETVSAPRVEIVLHPSATARGKVLDAASGQPIEGATVTSYDRSEMGLPPVRTDARGEFEVGPWQADTVAGLEVSAPGYGDDVARLGIHADGSWEAPARFGVPASEGDADAFVVFRLVPEKVIVGRLVDEAGEPVPGGRVTAQGMFLVAYGTGRSESAAAAAGADGAFELRGLRSDITHTLWARAPGRASRALMAPPDDVVFDAGAVVMLAESALSGLVQDAQGRPLPGVKVAVRSRSEALRELVADPDDGVNLNRDGFTRLSAFEAETTTGLDGTFRIAGLGPEDYELRSGIGQALAVQQRVTLQPRQETMLVEPIVLDRSYRLLAGRVLAEGVPAEGVLVELADPVYGTIGAMRSDRDGRFELWGLDEDERYGLRVSLLDAAGGRRTVLERTVGAEDSPLQLELP